MSNFLTLQQIAWPISVQGAAPKIVEVGWEGRAIDGVYAVFESLVAPLETYLKEQETFADRAEAVDRVENFHGRVEIVLFVCNQHLVIDFLHLEKFLLILPEIGDKNVPVAVSGRASRKTNAAGTM